MQAGKLRHRVEIQSRTTTQGSMGEPSDAWATLARVWASVQPVIGKEFFDAKKVGSEVTHKIKMRYRSGISPAYRVKFGTRYFQIISVLDVNERRIELLLMCKEII